MKGRSKYVFVVVLALSACSHFPTSPPTGGGNTPIPADTVKFSQVEVGDFFDSTVSLKFRSRDTITSAIMTDSNWTLLSALPLPLAKDSSAILTIRYQPRTHGAHAATISLLSHNNAVLNIVLTGSSSSPIPEVTASIDFGVVPLWREADTMFTLHVNGLAPITSVQFSDSDWSLLNSQPIQVRQQDSSVALSIRYQPRSITGHQGNLFLIFGHDTLGMISLTGGTSPFVRKIGDSYSFSTWDSANPTDSVWVVGLPMRLASNHPFYPTGHSLSSIFDTNGGDLYVPGIGCASGAIVPISSGNPTHFFYSNANFYERTDGSLGGDTIITIGANSLKGKIIAASTYYTMTDNSGGVVDQCSGVLTGVYCADIGFPTSLRYSWHELLYGGTSERDKDEEYHLRGFHLKR